jgi:voltage-gated potassium channel
LTDAPGLAGRKWRFLTLTLFLCAWMLLAPHLRDRWIMQLLLQLFLINFVVVTLWANPASGRLRRTLVGLWVIAAAGAALTMLPLDAAWHKLARTAESALLLPLLGLLAAGVLRYVFANRQLDTDGIFATIAAYLLIAFLFSQLYLIVLDWSPGSFDLPIAAAQRTTSQLHADMLYFSMITLATVGYGDILPVSSTARALAMIEATVGQFYVAVIVAAFVGMYSSRHRD